MLVYGCVFVLIWVGVGYWFLICGFGCLLWDFVVGVVGLVWFVGCVFKV